MTNFKKSIAKNFIFIIPALTPLYLLKISFLGLPTNAFEILAVLAIVLYLSQWKVIEPRKFWQKNRTLFIGVLLIIFGLISSLLVNKTYLVSLGILKSWFLVPIIFSLVLYSALKDHKDVLFVFKSIYLSIFIVALISLGYKLFGIVTFDNRLQGFYNSPNYLAMFLAPGIFLGLYFLKLHWQYNAQKYLYLFSLFVILLSLYFTYSYAAWVSVLVTLGVIFFIKKAYSLKTLAAFIIIVLVLLISQLQHQKLLDVVNNNHRSSLASRAMIWQASAKMIQNSPIFGIGAGNFQNTYLAYQKYFPLYLEWAVPHPHNLFLAFWLQAGVMGLMGFLLILFAIFKNLQQMIRNKKNAVLTTTLFAIFLYIVLHGMLDTTYWKNDLAFLFWIFVSIASKLKTKAI